MAFRLKVMTLSIEDDAGDHLGLVHVVNNVALMGQPMHEDDFLAIAPLLREHGLQRAAYRNHVNSAWLGLTL